MGRTVHFTNYFTQKKSTKTVGTLHRSSHGSVTNTSNWQFSAPRFSTIVSPGRESDLLGIDVASSSKPRKKRRKRVVVTKRHRRSWKIFLEFGVLFVLYNSSHWIYLLTYTYIYVNKIYIYILDFIEMLPPNLSNSHHPQAITCLLGDLCKPLLATVTGTGTWQLIYRCFVGGKSQVVGRLINRFWLTHQWQQLCNDCDWTTIT